VHRATIHPTNQGVCYHGTKQGKEIPLLLLRQALAVSCLVDQLVLDYTNNHLVFALVVGILDHLVDQI